MAVKKKAEKKRRPVIVTTEYKGVFFGYAEETDGEQITLTQARLCLYWPPETEGFMGLATMGPLKGSRIGAAAPSIKLRKVTSVLEVTPEAEERWLKAKFQM